MNIKIKIEYCGEVMKANAFNLSLLLLLFSQLGEAQQSCYTYIPDEWVNSRYIVEDISGDNIVTDKLTGLMWKQCSEGKTGSACDTVGQTTYNWQEALNLANVENFAGYNDWRLPNVKEILSLKKRNCDSPGINETIFPNTLFAFYWTSSPEVLTSNDHSYVVDFGGGGLGINHLSRTLTWYVRLVRDL
jgi:hypothetical protein